MRHFNAIYIQRLTVHYVVGSGQMSPRIERYWRGSIQFTQRSGDYIDKRSIVSGSNGG
jgi:hypothetical protein